MKKNLASLLLKKVYTVSKKHKAPRLWLQHGVCECAGFKPGEDLYVQVNEDEKMITIQNREFIGGVDIHSVHVSSRKSRISGEERPLVDTAGARYSRILSIQDKIEISVLRYRDYAQVIVRPLEYRLFDTDTFETSPDERIRLLSLCSGAGIGTSILKDTTYFTPVMEVEIDEDSGSVIKHNFSNSYLFNGDLRDCNVVAKADVAFVTLSCTESSTLGDGNEGCFDNLVLGAYKILQAAEPRVILFENVPSFYHSSPYGDLKELLSNEFSYWIGPITIDSYDYGSIAHRKRAYTLCMRYKEDFNLFRIPTPPAFRRKKLKEFLDLSSEHEWKDLDKWMNSFHSKAEKNNSWADRSIEKTFVDEESTELQCIPARYRSHSASNSYVVNKERSMWRFLTVNELRKIFYIPEWFEFPEWVPTSRIVEMIGQSVCGKVIKLLGNEIATVLFKQHAKEIKQKKQNASDQPLLLESNGQLSLVI